MIYKQLQVTLDTYLGEVNAKDIEYFEGNTSTCILDINLTENNVPCNLNNTRCMITIHTPHGAEIEDTLQFLDKSRGKLRYEMPLDSISELGRHKAQIFVFTQDGSQLQTSAIFKYAVNGVLGREGVRIDNRYDTLQQLIVEVEDLKQDVHGVIDDLVDTASVIVQEHETISGNKVKNIDLVEVKVEQEGLICANEKQTVVSDSFFVRVKVKETNGGTQNVIIVSTNKGKCFFQLLGSTDMQVYSSPSIGARPSLGGLNVVAGDWLEFRIMADYIGVKEVKTNKSHIVYNPMKATSVISFEPICDKWFAYNKFPTQGEIDEVLNTIDSTPSISHINATTNTGEKKTNLLAVDSYHVIGSNGKTAEERYTGLLNTMAEEFVSADGAPITINDGIEDSKILGGWLRGRTVKCLASKTTSTSLSMTGERRIYFDGKVDLSPSSQYKITINAEGIVGDCIISLVNSEHRPMLNDSMILQNGENVFIRTSISSSLITNYAYLSSNSSADASCKINYINIVNESDKDTVKGNILFGLNSTKAIISNNGQQYPIYEPTIVGKTSVFKAPKGTQNWVEIDPQETRDTTKFDYKLESLSASKEGLPQLESTPSINDTINRSTGVLTQNTKEIILDGTENWVKHAQSDSNTSMYALSGYTLGCVDNANTVNGICSSYKVFTANQVYNKDLANMGVSITLNSLYVRVNTSQASTVEQFKSLLQTNPIAVRYQLATPITRQLTLEEVKEYEAHKRIIELNKVEDISDSVKLNNDGSGLWTKESNIKNRFDESEIKNINVASTNTVRFSLQCDNIISGTYTSKCICSHLISKDIFSLDEEGIYISSGFIWIRLLKSKLSTWSEAIIAKVMNENNYEIKYVRNVPVSVYIPKESLKTPPIVSVNAIEVGSAVKSSGFKITVPVNKVAKLEARLSSLESVLNARGNLVLTDVYIQEELNKTLLREKEVGEHGL